MTVWLVAVSCCLKPRAWNNPVVSLLLAGAVVSSLCNAVSTSVVPLLVIYSFTAWAGLWALIVLAPKPEWITQRILWLAYLNAAYAVFQAFGHDFIFDAPNIVGFFSRRNQLGILLLCCLPLARRWGICLLLIGILASQSLTAMFGAILLAIWRVYKWHKWLGKAIVVAFLLCVVNEIIGHSVWESRLVPRLTTWGSVLTQIFDSPTGIVKGYGLGAWEAWTRQDFDRGYWFYNSYLAAWHIGGLLLLTPVVYAVWWVWKQKSCPEKLVLLLIGATALVQTPWHFTRLIVVTIGFGAALLIRRIDEIR